MTDIKLTLQGTLVTADAYGQKQVFPITQLADLMANHAKGITKNGSTDSGILPVALRWFNTDLSSFVFERPPGLVPIYYTNSLKEQAKKVANEKKQKYELPFPWSTYVLNVNGMNWDIKVFFRDSPITGLTDDLLAIPLPNGYGTGSFCSSHLYSTELETAQNKGKWTLADAANFIFNFLWTTNFNNNAGSEPYPLPTKATKMNTWTNWLEEWQSWSIPQSLDAGWRPSKNLNELIFTQKHVANVDTSFLYSNLVNGK
jgi:hypothetical protein